MPLRPVTLAPTTTKPLTVRSLNLRHKTSPYTHSVVGIGCLFVYNWSGGYMMNRKSWIKPTIEVAQIAAAQAGSYTTTDDKSTHRS